MTQAADEARMRRAIQLGASVRTSTSPNPWVGCVIETRDGATYEGATSPPGGPHAEAVALAAATRAGASLDGATAWVTLEPCSHDGRTPPCADALVEAGLARVVIGAVDADARVAGRGIDTLVAGGIGVVQDVLSDDVRESLAPYLTHRSTGRPYVVLKLATSLDGRTAAPDGTSQWITGEAARIDAHRLRAESDAVLVGAGTVRADDPSLTVRLVKGRDPLRVVLGRAPREAKVHPALELDGDLGDVLDDLGRRDVMQVLVEGGSRVAHAFHHGGFVDRYVLYLAPAFFGGEDAIGLFSGPGASTIADVWRGRIVGVERLGDDLRVDVAAA